MSKSDYQKYLKYKKKYLAIKKHLRGGCECIGEERSRSFMEKVNANYTPYIKPLPENMNDIPFQAYLGFPDEVEAVDTSLRRSTRGTSLNPFKKIVEELKDDNIINLTLQVTENSDKHAILLYFNKERKERKVIELWDSNGYCLGLKTWGYLEKLLEYLRNNIIEGESVDYVVSNEEHHNINHIGKGHCDALTLFYAILRQGGYEKAQYIYKIDWTKLANIKTLNTYIKQNKIEELKDFEENNLFILN
tara:strand:- start:10937 stop:11680 length:744 start_codon:yes stop_codon:yes gene_type:complete